MRLALTLLLLLILWPIPGHAGTGGWINEYRYAHHRRRVSANLYLNYKAHQWAVYLARHEALAHGDLPAFGRFSWIGQNVGKGPSWWAVEKAFRASPEHRANELCRCYSQVGTAGVWRGNTIYVVQDYRG